MPDGLPGLLVAGASVVEEWSHDDIQYTRGANDLRTCPNAYHATRVLMWLVFGGHDGNRSRAMFDSERVDEVYAQTRRRCLQVYAPVSVPSQLSQVATYNGDALRVQKLSSGADTMRAASISRVLVAMEAIAHLFKARVVWKR
jgi:hypothetical protein